MPKEKLNPDHNELTAYKRVEENARNRAKEIQKIYFESVPQAKWLRLDINGAVLMTPEEFSLLPSKVREFFSLGNMSHYKNDRVALRGENVILLDGHYPGGVSGDLRSERFLSVAEKCLKSIPALLAQLSDQNKEQWKAKLALWDILSSLSVAQFHALKGLSLLEHNPNINVSQAERDMSLMFEAYFSTLLGKSTDGLVDDVAQGIRSIIDSVSSEKDALVRHGSYDLFRIEREAMGASALMGGFSWVADGKLLEIDMAIGIPLGGIDATEAVRFLDRHRNEMGFSERQFPRTYAYVLPRVKMIGQSSRTIGKRLDVVPLLDAQEDFFRSIPKNSRIVIIDDMITTASTVREVEAILHVHDFRNVKFLVNQVGTRWAVNDVAAPEVLDSVYAVAISPTTRTFQGKHLGIEKLLQRMRTHQSLDAIRRVSRGSEIISYLRKAKMDGAAQGVGFDIFGTLIEDVSYDTEKRRKVLRSLWLAKIRAWLPELTLEKFLVTYNHAREHREISARRDLGQFAEFRDDELWLEVLNALGISHPNQKIHEILGVELEYDRQVRSPVTEMVNAVKEAITLYGKNAVGVFSNSRMPREHVVDLLKAYGFVGEGMLKEENVLVSSDLGVKKPDSRTIEALAHLLSIQTRKLIFIGNDLEDIRAAGRANAIGVQLVRATTEHSSENK